MPDLVTSLPADLIASYWTLACGSYPGAVSEASPWPIDERLEAAAMAGFTGVGLHHSDLQSLMTSLSVSQLARIVDRSGLRQIELECLEDWFADGEARATSDRVRVSLLRAADALGARHIKVVGDQSARHWPRDVVVEAFAALCVQAAEVGTAVVLEPMPFSDLPDIHAAAEIVRLAGARNGALAIDVWHIVRARTPLADVAGLEPGLIGYVELDDAAAQPVGDLYSDTIDNRRLCGQGAFDLPGFLDAVQASGYRGPFGVEIISRAQRALTPRTAATAAFTTTAAVVARRAAGYV